MGAERVGRKDVTESALRNGDREVEGEREGAEMARRKRGDREGRDASPKPKAKAGSFRIACFRKC